MLKLITVKRKKKNMQCLITFLQFERMGGSIICFWMFKQMIFDVHSLTISLTSVNEEL